MGYSRIQVDRNEQTQWLFSMFIFSYTLGFPEHGWKMDYEDVNCCLLNAGIFIFQP